MKHNVNEIIRRIVNFKRSGYTPQRYLRFITFLEEIEIEYGDFPLLCNVSKMAK